MNSLITMDRDNSVTRYRAISISGYTDIKYPYNKLPRYIITTDLDIHISGYIDTLYRCNQLYSYFITGYLNNYVSRYIVTKELQCPTALSGRSKRKSGAPDFSRLPCGAGLFLVYRRYTLPSRLMQGINKKYTLWYTNNC
jgi:hypothetical protein